MRINPSSWPVPVLFEWLAQAGRVSPAEMFNTFNMGIGFAVVLPPDQLSQGISWFQSQGLAAYAIGEVIEGSGAVVGLA